MLNKKQASYFLLGLILIAHTLILIKLMFFPYPELFVYPYLTNHGLKPYSQILDQHFPGLLFLPINFDNLGMNDEYSARIWLIALIVITHLLLFLISRKILKSDNKALLVNVLYLVWQPFFEGWVLWLDTFLPLFLLSAFYLLINKRYFLTGLFLGLGIVFKQTIIPLAGLTFLYILWEKKTLELLLNYTIGLFLPIILMLLYITNIGVLNDFIYWTIVFNLTVFAEHGTSTPATVGFITRIALVYLTSFLSLLYKDKRLVKILLIFLAGSFLSIFDRADFVHLQPSLPFVMIATVLGLFSIRKRSIQIVLVLGYSLITLWWLNIFYKGHISDEGDLLSFGNKVFFFDFQTKEIANKIKQYTDDEEKIFIFGSVPHLYQMSKTKPAGDIFVFQFPWFIKVAGGRILEGIKRDQPKIIVSDSSVRIEGHKVTDFAKEIDQYIQKNYKVIDNIGTTSILRKK